MGVFAFPRINVKGLISINVGTANNDDYSSSQFPPGSKFAGQPLRLADSVRVQPMLFGMSDDEWIRWAQTPGPFVKQVAPAGTDPCAAAPAPAPQVQATPAALATKAETVTPRVREDHLIPAEWNYYGDMGLEMRDVRVVGVQYPDRLATDPGDDPLVGAALSFKNRPDETGRSTGLLIDINPEDVPCSAIFANSLMLRRAASRSSPGSPA